MGQPISAIRYGQYETGTGLADVVGQGGIEVPDQDLVGANVVINSKKTRSCRLVQNKSGTTLANAVGLKWATGYEGYGVTLGTTGAPICGYTPYTIDGSLTLTIPNGAYFLMVENKTQSPTKVKTDGAAITVADLVEIGVTSGKLKTDATVPAANKDYRGGQAMASAAAQGTGAQVYVSIET